jgi:hypothetical protein
VHGMLGGLKARNVVRAFSSKCRTSSSSMDFRFRNISLRNSLARFICHFCSDLGERANLGVGVRPNPECEFVQI